MTRKWPPKLGWYFQHRVKITTTLTFEAIFSSFSRNQVSGRITEVAPRQIRRLGVSSGVDGKKYCMTNETPAPADIFALPEQPFGAVSVCSEKVLDSRPGDHLPGPDVRTRHPFFFTA
jgi:hypothetical protein